MRVEVTGPVVKGCPYEVENDHGHVTLIFGVGAEGDAPELHSLARYLAGFAVRRISHEEFTREVLREYEDKGCVEVRSTWTTAGMHVLCST